MTFAADDAPDGPVRPVPSASDDEIRALYERAASLSETTRLACSESQALRSRNRTMLDEIKEALVTAQASCRSRRHSVFGPAGPVKTAPSALSPAEAERDGVDAVLVSFTATRDPDDRARVLAAYDAFALGIARAFPSRRESAEDLAQVARIGLFHAVERFDPRMGRPFTTFARATIVGELKRHVRDRTWSMRVPRSLQEHYLVVVRSADDLTAELGRSPSIGEVAVRCGLTEEQVLEAMELGGTQRPLSLDAPRPEADGPGIDPGLEDVEIGRVEGRQLLAGLIARLPEREREVLQMRFGEELTQAQIAERIGVSQMYVSRLLARTLARMRIWAQSN